MKTIAALCSTRYEVLLAHKPQDDGQKCPYEQEGCNERMLVGAGLQSCKCGK